ncbi:hypothetical protein CC80DRAFT_545396 [Byssothecium circinans]|uniref:Uncharacterized protein n=1 Tax=Byssothecium circinans TaxID=147558 RepID=A0A6A5U4A2_9PLEO|nr:hypothetical protein CC80DRAFT_545396 [Byssothecium circinans]
MAVAQDVIVSMASALDFFAQALAVPAVVALMAYPDDKPESSCTTSNRYPTCTTKFVVVTSVYPDLSSRTTSTSTSSTCYAVTACTGSATTVSTTTQTATTVQKFCEKTSCGNACARTRERRVAPSDTPKLDKPPALEDHLDSSNLTIFDTPEPGTGDWGDWYEKLRRKGETITIVNDNGVLGTNTAIAQVMWGNTKQNILVENLVGCIAVFCVSNIGAFVAHFWEKPSILHNFQADVINILQIYLGSRLNPILLGPEPACYIMAGSKTVIGDNNAEDQETLTRSDPTGWVYQSEVNQIRGKILELLPGAYVSGFAYARQVKEDILLEKGYGKGAVLFDPNQAKAGDIRFPPGYATVAVYHQGYQAIQFYWPHREFQIWRAHPRDGPAVNIALLVDRGTVLDPCRGDVDPPNIESSETVPRGSEITDVGPEVSPGTGGPGQPFKFRDSADNVVDENCVFRGGPYAPTADSGSGVVAGVLSCKFITAQCTRPYVNLATTCGGKPAAQCGTLGVDCSKFYQLLATCKW